MVLFLLLLDNPYYRLHGLSRSLSHLGVLSGFISEPDVPHESLYVFKVTKLAEDKLGSPEPKVILLFEEIANLFVVVARRFIPNENP